MRVSSLIYTYRIYYLMMDEPNAKSLLYQIWTPNLEWAQLIRKLDKRFLGQFQSD
jgi:hypothetical protein